MYKETKDYWGDRLDAIKSHIVQIFKVDSLNEPVSPKPWASAVFIEYNSRFFLLSASHILENGDFSHIGFCHNETFYLLKGDLRYTKAKAEDEEDIVDYLFFEPSESVTDDLLSFYKPLQQSQLLPNHIISETNEYGVVGYPCSKTTLNQDRTIMTREPFNFITIGITDEKKIARIEAKPELNIVVDFHKDKLLNSSTNLRVQAPAPYGNSGTGLWLINKDSYYLVGILTGFDYIETVFVGVKINIILDEINLKYSQAE